MKTVGVVTGTRADYGILRPVLEAIRNNAHLRLLLLVTGMHLLPAFGSTIKEILADGFDVDATVDILTDDDTALGMAHSIGAGIIGMSKEWQRLKPDIVLVLGDRVEMLAGAISATYMNICLAHIHGGDQSKGSLDDYARNAISQMADLHFPATQQSCQRLVDMGIDRANIYMVGSPAVDAIRNDGLLSVRELENMLSLDLSRPFILAVQHPETTQIHKATDQMRETMEALLAINLPTIIIYPNSDAGGQEMRKVIKEYEGHSLITTFKNLPHILFLSLMRIATVMVGNSSSGIIEAPSFGLPVVNVGIRQEGRERGSNVIDVNHSKQEIMCAVEKSLTDKEFLRQVHKCQSPYGDGTSSRKIAEVLAQVKAKKQ